jgi:peptidoglycan/xylan/chitin deacetylase (PgdA/CDA1 family)
MYHYVRDLPNTPFPAIKGMLTNEFADQVAFLRDNFEMATLRSALDYIAGTYHPVRHLCLLTFDDGLKDHHFNVLPILIEHRVQGVFFLITGAVEDRRVATVHKGHFLMASLGFEDYRREFLESLAELSPETPIQVDPNLVRQAYRWDSPEVGSFKYLQNFSLEPRERDSIIASLFVKHFGDERAFSDELYLGWDEAREMQSSGMVIGGHSHQHQSLALMSQEDQKADLERCAQLLRARLAEQEHWPFSYPFGKMNTFTQETIKLLQQVGFECAFASEVGSTLVGYDRFARRRIDPKDVKDSVTTDVLKGKT